MDYSAIRKHQVNSVNPFLEGFSIGAKTKLQHLNPVDVNTSRHLLLNERTGEMEGYSTFVKKVQVDDEQFLKLFHSKFSVFLGLGNPGTMVLSYVMSVLEKDKDRFFFSSDDCLKYTGYKHLNSVYSGVGQLIEAKIIARTNMYNFFFINPRVCFNGNRFAILEEYNRSK